MEMYYNSDDHLLQKQNKRVIWTNNDRTILYWSIQM